MSIVLTVDHEFINLSNGNVRTNLWVSEYDGLEDGGVFLLKDNTGMVDTFSEYRMVCNPCTLVEYPLSVPEGPKGCFRSTHASLVHDSKKAATASLTSILQRVTTLRSFMATLLDPEGYTESEEQIGPFLLTTRTTKKILPFQRLIMTLPNTDNVFKMTLNPVNAEGTMAGICTPVEMNTLGQIAGVAAGWRTNGMDLMMYTSLVQAMISTIKSDLANLAESL